MSQTNAVGGGPVRRDDELKQALDSELSQLVQRYQRKGLDAGEIADSMLWHTELAVTREDSVVELDTHVEE